MRPDYRTSSPALVLRASAHRSVFGWPLAGDLPIRPGETVTPPTIPPIGRVVRRRPDRRIPALTWLQYDPVTIKIKARHLSSSLLLQTPRGSHGVFTTFPLCVLPFSIAPSKAAARYRTSGIVHTRKRSSMVQDKPWLSKWVVGQFEFGYVSVCKFHNRFYGARAQLKDVHY